MTSDHTSEPGSDAGTDELQADIEKTREQLGNTVDALTQKLDVKSRAKAGAGQAKDNAAEAVQGIRERPAVPAAVAGAVVLVIVALVIWRNRAS